MCEPGRTQSDPAFHQPSPCKYHTRHERSAQAFERVCAQEAMEGSTILRSTHSRQGSVLAWSMQRPNNDVYSLSVVCVVPQICHGT